MATSKQIGQRPAKKTVTKMDTLHDTWTVMKPFIHFSIKALRVIGLSLVFIIKHIPKPESHKVRSKKDKVIKI